VTLEVKEEPQIACQKAGTFFRRGVAASVVVMAVPWREKCL
jgi:hypothetical protein